MTRVDSVFVFSDLHLDGQPVHAALDGALQIVEQARPSLVVLAGDVLELSFWSRFPWEEGDALEAAPELRQGAALVDRLLAAGCGVTIMPGNHEARLCKALFGGRGRGSLRGLPFGVRDVWAKAGLSPRARWVEEGLGCPGLWLGSGSGTVLVRHGDMQAGGGKGAGNLAAKLQRENPTVSVVHGHHHRAEIRHATSLGVTRFWAANPCLAPLRLYYSGGDDRWERGFTEILLWDGGRRSTARVHVAQQGSYAWGDRVFVGQGRQTPPPPDDIEIDLSELEGLPQRTFSVGNLPERDRRRGCQAVCQRGHARGPENTRYINGKPRGCMTCYRERQRRFKAARRRS